jgi:hypothetical protein
MPLDLGVDFLEQRFYVSAVGRLNGAPKASTFSSDTAYSESPAWGLSTSASGGRFTGTGADTVIERFP